MKNWTSIKVQGTHKQISAVLALLWAASVVADPVPLQPTAPGTAPDAILGTAGEPVGESVSYFSEDDQTTGYLAEPAGPGPHGAVVLIHDWKGLHDLRSARILSPSAQLRSWASRNRVLNGCRA